MFYNYNMKIKDTRRQLHDGAGGHMSLIFDLQGRQTCSSLKNGLYIQNGQKMVVK